MGCAASVLEELERVIEDRVRRRPPNSYTAMLASRGLGYAARKLGEEAIELVVEALEGDRRRVVEEAADLLYHLLVVLTLRGIRLEEVLGELEARRRGKSSDN